MLYTPDHYSMMDTVRRFVSQEINPYADEWEAAEIFPAHELFKKMGDLGLLGVNKPVEYGGLGLDFSYALAIAEALGTSHSQGIGMAIGVQTDMATPSLAIHGSDALRRQYLAPAISGEMVVSIGVSEQISLAFRIISELVRNPGPSRHLLTQAKMCPC